MLHHNKPTALQYLKPLSLLKFDLGVYETLPDLPVEGRSGSFQAWPDTRRLLHGGTTEIKYEYSILSYPIFRTEHQYNIAVLQCYDVFAHTSDIQQPWEF